MTHGHIDSHFESQLQHLRTRLLHMGAEIERNMADAVRALREGNDGLAREVVARDGVINCLEVEIDAHCVRLLALYQPVASDLRFVVTALKMNTDLERMGDLAAHMAELVVELSRGTRLLPFEDVSRMVGVVQEMLGQALDAFVKRDAELARGVIRRDKEVDALHRQVKADLLGMMNADTGPVTRGVALLTAARHAERMGDHAKNIAEMVVFMVLGRDIRHLKSRRRAKEEVEEGGEGLGS